MIHLQGLGTDVVVDIRHGVPEIVHWGAPLGDIDTATIAAASERPVVQASPDVVAPISIVPEHGSGFPGRPGLRGHRPGGAHWAPRFLPAGHVVTGTTLEVTAVDPIAELTLRTRITLGDTLVVSVELRNDAATDSYDVDGLSISLPVPERATELGTFTGRWTREFQPTRRQWADGSHTAENRHGRTSHETPPLVFAGTPGYGEWSGEVWGAHLAWSGNHRWLAERLTDGRRYLQLEELLHPGELSLGPGQSYHTPEVVAVYADAGLTAATQGFHRHLRARATHPTAPRPVLVNTWEAVYFDHDLATLTALADRASRVGVERFVLDDGWFGSRRDDSSGLGDWVVSEDAHPEGLAPLIEHVTGLGMEFGIWVEPEMVNPDSDVYRAHPEWALTTDGYQPVLARHQLVLDLARADAFEHVLTQLDELLRDHDIAFVKWDMNRDHIGGSGASGAAGSHAQTLALYRLLDELHARHPDVEIESCSSGGARIDHEILRRTVRVWTSDCNDALERQTIQRGVSMLIPPELMGAHIGPERSHTTGRRHDLPFRAATALFGHLGIEWNLLTLDDDELDQVAATVALHQRFRPLLHGGDAVRFDTEATLVAHGVYNTDRTEGLVAVARIATATSLTTPPLIVPGLSPQRNYAVRIIELPGQRQLGPNRLLPAWIGDELTMSGRQLAVSGLQLPALHPETAILLHLASD